MRSRDEILRTDRLRVLDIGEDGMACEMRYQGQWLRIIASWGMGWDHVSVSRGDRVPTWSEIDALKRVFFKDDETAMQLHVPPREHINYHSHCLHLWRPHALEIPRPPGFMVA